MNRPDIRFVAGWMLIALLVACNADAPSEETPADKQSTLPTRPIIALDRAEYNFGTVKQGQTAEVVIKVTNRGTMALHISAVEASCGCTAAAPSSRDIAPGKSADVRVSVDTTGRAGAFSKTITINSNDPDKPSATAAINGTIVQDIVIEPRLLHMGDVVRGQTASKDITITSTDPAKVQITSVTVSDTAHFRVDPVTGPDVPAGSWRVTFNGAMDMQPFQTLLKVAFTGSDATSIEQKVYATVVSDLKYPSRMFLRRVAGKYVEREIRFTSRSGKPFRLISVDDEEKNLDLQVKKGKTPSEWVVIANVKDHAKDYDAMAEYAISVKTTDKDEPVAKIIYSIVPEPVAKYDRPGARIPPLSQP